MEGGIADPFPEINASKQLNLGVPEDFPVDPISSKLDTAKFYQEEEAAAERARAEARARAKESEKRKLGSTLMSTLVISGVVAAAIAAAFIVSKRLKNASS